jgi:hypothetical protein
MTFKVGWNVDCIVVVIHLLMGTVTSQLVNWSESSLDCLKGLLKSKSKLLYDWQSVSQYVRVRVRVTLRLTVSQSVRLGFEPTPRLTTRCYFPLEVWCLKFSVLFLFGRPLWREIGSVISQSKSVVVCQGKIHINIFCVIHILVSITVYLSWCLEADPSVDTARNNTWIVVIAGYHGNPVYRAVAWIPICVSVRFGNLWEDPMEGSYNWIRKTENEAMAQGKGCIA